LKVICGCSKTEATISADKMNVVYRGVVNPTISFAGIADKDVNASARFDKVGNGKFSMSPSKWKRGSN
jgi:hypothetical protein